MMPKNALRICYDFFNAGVRGLNFEQLKTCNEFPIAQELPETTTNIYDSVNNLGN